MESLVVIDGNKITKWEWQGKIKIVNGGQSGFWSKFSICHHHYQNTIEIHDALLRQRHDIQGWAQ